MGMFDTYRLEWGDAILDVQTKQLECCMSAWSPGQRVPLSTHGESIYGNEAGEEIIPELAAPSFACLVEDASLGSLYHNDALCCRHFALGHSNGIFADYASFLSKEQAASHAEALAGLWGSELFGRALSRQLALLIERNASAELSLAHAKEAIDGQFANWRADLIEKRNPAPPAAKPKFTFGYHGPDFAGISRRAAKNGLDQLCSHWPSAMLGFAGALAPAEPCTPEQRLALDVAASWGGLFSTRRLGAPAPDQLARLSEPASLPPPATPERAMRLLSAGQWRLFELDAIDLAGDSAFAAQAQEALAELCLSRIGACWAAGAMARNPQLAFESLSAGGARVPLIDWMACGVGLPSELVAPLFATRAASSPELAHHCLAGPHLALLPLAAERQGGYAAIPPLSGVSFAEQAIHCHCLAALRALASHGALPAGSGLPDLACEVDRKYSNIGMPWEPKGFGDLEQAPLPLACAGLLMDCGLFPSPSTPKTARMSSYCAMRRAREDQQAIEQASSHGTEAPRGKARL